MIYTIGTLSDGNLYRSVSFGGESRITIVIGITLPINITRLKNSWPIGLSDDVIPIEDPHVTKAETRSKNKLNNPILFFDSIIDRIIVAITRKDKAKRIIVIAFRICDSSISLPKIFA